MKQSKNGRPSGMSVYEQYAVGFVRSSPTIGGDTAAYHCGSGTLVNMGGVHGILTAGHVLRQIEHDKHFVMLSATGPTDRADSRKVAIEPGSMLIEWAGAENRDGPDIGFVRLPNDARDWALQNRAFYNYAVRYQLYEEGSRPLLTDNFYTLGALGEGSKIEASGNGRNAVTTNIGFFSGDIKLDEETLAGSGSLVFMPRESDANPDSYEGLSGAGVWAVNQAGGPLGHILIGVIYYQDEPIERGVRPLIFHSVDWAYNWLYDEVSKRFSSEFKPFDPATASKA